jgi:NarL family two-component system sensor histidine kinase YdfH
MIQVTGICETHRSLQEQQPATMSGTSPATQASATPFDRTRELRSSRWYLILWIGVVYAWGMIQPINPARMQGRELLFTALMLAHAAVYWISLSLAQGRLRRVLYCLVQTGLVATISFVTYNPFVILGLYIALNGATVLLLGQLRPAALAVTGNLALALFTIWLSIPATGNIILFSAFVIPVTLFVVGGAALLLEQANARVRMRALLAELETAHRQLAEYADRVEDLTLAAERQRMARELHDTLAQGLAGLILQLEAANSHQASGRSDRAQEIVQQAMARARATLADARRAIDGLREGPAGRADLPKAVREEVARFATATGIPCALDLALPPALPDAVHEHALRAVAEGLTNVARHAQATQAWVRLSSAGDRLEIQVRDDGIGFDPATAAQAGHYGLLGMRERARLAGGRLEIVSSPGTGTTLRLSLPLVTATGDGRTESV